MPEKSLRGACDSCGKTYKIPDRGKTYPCKSCGEGTVSVVEEGDNDKNPGRGASKKPDLDRKRDGSATSRARSGSARRGRSNPSHSSKLPLIVGGVIGLVALIIFVTTQLGGPDDTSQSPASSGSTNETAKTSPPEAPPKKRSLEETVALFVTLWNESKSEEILELLSPLHGQKGATNFREALAKREWTSKLPEIGKAVLVDSGRSRFAAYHPLVSNPKQELLVRWQDEDEDWCILTFKFPKNEEESTSPPRASSALESLRRDSPAAKLQKTFRLALDAARSGKGSEQSVTLTPNWNIGDSLQLELEKSNTSEETEAILLSTTPINIEVLERTDDGFLLRWTYGKTQTSGALANILDSFIQLSSGLELVIRTDSHGQPKALENGGDVHSIVKVLEKRITDGIAASQMGAAEADFLQALLEVAKEPEILEVSLLQEPRYFLLACGQSLATGTPKEFEETLTTPFGPDRVPTEAFLVLLALEKAKNEAVLEWQQSIHEEKGRETVDRIMRSLAKRLDITYPEVFKPQLAIVESAQITFNTSTGWPTGVIFERAVATDTDRTSVTTRFRVFKLESK